ncbi:MAG: NnrU family protein [Hyphomonadaceae bacterium]
MPSFAAALMVFVLLHVGVSATGLRALIVGKTGERAYLALFSLASAAALVWMIFAFAALREDAANPYNQALYVAPAWGRYAAQALTLLAFLLVVPGLLTPGPTTVGMEGALARGAEAKGVHRITRHPFLWGVALWALGHLFANGERYALMLFGAFGVLALFGTRSIDRKRAARDPEGWAAYTVQTSNIPFAAIVQGRNRFSLGEIWWKWAAALVVYAAFAYAHQWIVGAPAIP